MRKEAPKASGGVLSPGDPKLVREARPHEAVDARRVQDALVALPDAFVPSATPKSVIWNRDRVLTPIWIQGTNNEEQY